MFKRPAFASTFWPVKRNGHLIQNVWLIIFNLELQRLERDGRLTERHCIVLKDTFTIYTQNIFVLLHIFQSQGEPRNALCSLSTCKTTLSLVLWLFPRPIPSSNRLIVYQDPAFFPPSSIRKIGILPITSPSIRIDMRDLRSKTRTSWACSILRRSKGRRASTRLCGPIIACKTLTGRNFIRTSISRSVHVSINLHFQLTFGDRKHFHNFNISDLLINLKNEIRIACSIDAGFVRLFE